MMIGLYKEYYCVKAQYTCYTSSVNLAKATLKDLTLSDKHLEHSLNLTKPQI